MENMALPLSRLRFEGSLGILHELRKSFVYDMREQALIWRDIDIPTVSGRLSAKSNEIMGASPFLETGGLFPRYRRPPASRGPQS